MLARSALRMRAAGSAIQRFEQQTWITATVVVAVIGLSLAIGSGNQAVLIGSLGVIAGAAILVRPFVGLCLLVLMVPLEEGLLLTHDLTALKLVGALVFLGWLAQWALHRRAIVPRPLLVALLLFGLWGLASCLWAGSLLAAMYRWTSMLQMIGFAYLIVQLADSSLRLSILIASNLIGALIAAGFAYHNYLQYGASNPALRATAFIGSGSVDVQNADNYPILLSLGAAFCLVRAVTSRGLVRLPWALGAATLTMAALISGTRSFVVGFGAAVVVLALLLRREGRMASRAFLAIVIALVTIVSVATLPGYIVDRVSTAPSALFKSSDLGSGRVDIWKVYLGMIARNPVVGVGIGNGAYAFPAYAAKGSGVVFPIRRSPLSEESLGSDPHSDIIMVLAELGVVGLGLFVVFVWMVVGEFVRSLLSVSHRSRLWPLGLATAMYLTTVLVADLVDTRITKKMLWLAIGLALAFAHLARQEAAVLATHGDRDPS
jgi:O-antigen ligase